MIVQIASGVTESLLAEARRTHPAECCGLVTGRPGIIETMGPAKNVSDHPLTSFEIDPAVLLRTHRESRAQGGQVIGHYHSHPDGSAEPSRRDAARAVENGQIWLIIANGSVTAWQVMAQNEAHLHGRFVPVALVPA